MSDNVMSIREQSHLTDEWLAIRLATVVPTVMKRAGIDCWVLIAGEYNEDPVVKTMLPASWLNARRRTILVFTAFGAERVAIARYAVGSAFPAGWSPEETPDQWQRLAQYLTEANPQHIAVDRSPTFSLANGISATGYEQLLAALPEYLRTRVQGSDDLAVGWLETRIPDEMAYYPNVCAAAHRLLRRALSPEVISPETTTTDDVAWWLRQESAELGYGSWFHPNVSVQRDQRAERSISLAAGVGEHPIVPGDLVHIDFGIVSLGLHTDQQQHGYVLRPGESKAPEGLVAGIRHANLTQDILLSEFRSGRTGNEILAATLQQAASADLAATVYSHPIGLHGHGAGPTIGLWDHQSGVPGAGDYRLWPDTAYSIELSVTRPVPEWGDQEVRFMLEEDAYFDGTSIEYLDGRQQEIWLI